MRSVFTIILLIALGAAGAESFQVTNVVGPDRVVVLYRGLPVSVSLANVEIAPDLPAQRACQERLSALVRGKNVDVVYRSAFGAAPDGGARVHLLVPGSNVNATLVASGLARYAAGPQTDPFYDDVVKKAEEKAKKEKLGLWGAAAPAAPVTPAPVAEVAARPTAAPAAKSSAVSAATAAPTGPFCSELDNKYYYPRGDQAVANVSAQRLIYYPDEAAAKRAGKIPNQSGALAVAAGDGSEKSGDAIFAKGKETYAQAIAMGNTSERDVKYEQAYVILSQAMNIYGTLCEGRPDDEGLAEKLRECMQLRYGSIKQRRF